MRTGAERCEGLDGDVEAWWKELVDVCLGALGTVAKEGAVDGCVVLLKGRAGR
jgi:hypothetical protein